MTDNIKDVMNYLEWFQTIYGNEIRFDGELAVQDGLTKPEKEIPLKSPIVEKKIKSIGFDEYLVHHDSKELKTFFRQINSCEKCALGKTRNNFVFGMGNPHADIMFIGEAPGRDEDLKGLPFVGKAGQLLDKMLFSLKLKREEVYIANILKCRPPNNRDPLPDEVSKCEPYLKKQIELIKPKIIIALGRISAQVLLKRADSLSLLRQDTHQYENTPFIVTYHPAALLRNPRWKMKAWEDLRKIAKYR